MALSPTTPRTQKPAGRRPRAFFVARMTLPSRLYDTPPNPRVPMFDTEEQAPPTLEPAVFAELEKTLAAKGPAAAIDELCVKLRAAGDYNALFYALLMKKRLELGV